MSRFVLDTSVTMAWCFEDESSAAAIEILGSLTRRQAVVPAPWPAEVASALWVGERRRRITPAETRRFLALLEGLNIQVDEPLSYARLGEVLAIAREQRISPYDASFLELAIREALPLATIDRVLRKAAEDSGIRVFS